MTDDSKRWESLLRGSALSATVSKHVQYVGFADRRAQGIVGINSFIIPIALSGIGNEEYRTMIFVALIFSFLTIVCAVFSMYPKKYTHEAHGHINLLHFSGIEHLSEKEYLDKMRTAINDPSNLTEMVAIDIHHLATKILQPKFYWLKLSYILFLSGASIVVLLALSEIVGW